MKNRRLLALFFSFVLAMGLGSAFAYADDGGASADITVATVAPQEGEDPAGVSWEAADFTFGDYEKSLYGCDYSREFVLSGKVITGFSEAGEAKLAESKDLVIPAKDVDGNTIVGVGSNAFAEKGLTSVEFPTIALVDYNDEATHGHITKRGNFIIAESAFAKNNLTEVTLPNGVLAVLSGAFQSNQITRVNFPRTIWWIETVSFAHNAIEYVNFPQTCDFQLEMHGMAFADNNIKAVRLPDFTEVVNMHTFDFNPGMEPIPADAPDVYKTYGSGENAKECGVVYMYADADLMDKGRIHHIDRETTNTKSWAQRLIINNSPESEAFTPYNETQLAQWGWTAADFTFDGSVVTGLSESGLAKRADGKHRELVIPERTSEGINVTEIGAAGANAGGLFATADEGFDSVYIPSYVTKIGANAFRALGNTSGEGGIVRGGLQSVVFPPDLQEIGTSAFMMNNLTSVNLPNKVTTVGGGAFSTNPDLTYIGLSNSLTEIAASAFGCSDGKNYMTGLTELEIPAGVTKIGARAFAGSNIQNIVIPDGVTEIATYAFSTKNYLNSTCTLSLPEGLTTIGDRAFRNKVIESVVLPTTVTKLPTKVFEKEYSDGTVGVNTFVLVSNEAQYNDRTNFPLSDYHTLYYTESTDWTAADFTYGEWSSVGSDIYPPTNSDDKLEVTVRAVTGFSQMGLVKLQSNTDLVIPEFDLDGNKVLAVAASAFAKKGLTSVVLPSGVKTANDKPGWNADLSERGNFFIGASAFQGNKLTDIEIPEGVLYIALNAFQGNQLKHVKLPSTLMYIGNVAFGKNEITSVEFPEATDFPLTLCQQSFAVNGIKSVQVPTDIGFMNKWVFLQNTGMEPITTGTSAEKKGGLVYVYVTDKSKIGSLVDYKGNGKSNVQEIVEGTIPAVDAPWGLSDFTFDEAGTTVTGLSEAGKAKLKVNPNLVIPDKNGDADITGIGAGVMGTGAIGDTYEGNIGTFGFKEAGEVYVPTSVVLPARLQTIGDSAFSAYLDSEGGAHKGLTAISFPSTLTTIGNTAFQNAPLSSVSIPDSVTSVGQAAFSTTENSVVKITVAKLSKNAPVSANMFIQQAIKDIEIPEGVTTIGQRAFQGNYSETLSLPSTVTAIPNYAFDNNQFSEVVIPDSVKTIGTYAFRINTEGKPKTLSSVCLPEGLTSIGNQAFAGSNLTSVDLPTTVTTVHKDAFKGSVLNVKLISNVADQANATGDYTKVVTNGSGHTVVYNQPLGNGWFAYDFTYSEDGTTINGFSEDGKAKAQTNHELVLPDVAPDAEEGVVITAIAEAAFSGEDESVIGKTGYTSENGMTSVKLPSGLTIIAKDAFAFNALTEMTFADCPNIKVIGETAFKGNDLSKVELPDTVTELGGGAFSANNITTLKLSNGLTSIPQAAFSMNIRLREISIPETVTEIGESAFAGARLESLTIPASVTKIDKAAFKLHHIANLTVPGTVKELGESAFEGTYKEQTLTSLTLEEGIESIGRYAFKEGLLTEVKLPSSLQTLGEEPFLNNVGENGNGVVKALTDNPAHLGFNEVDPHPQSFIVVYSVDNAINAIEEIGDISAVTDMNSIDPEAVAAASEAYSALTDEQKAEVSTEVADKLAVAEALVAVNAIGDEVSDVDAAQAAIDAYDALTDGQKTLVNDVVKEAVAGKKNAVNHAAADRAVAAIDAIGSKVTTESKDAIDKARAAYDALRDEQKALVDPAKVAALESAEKAYAQAVADEKAAAAKAAADKAAADKAAASNVNTATVTAAQVKKASDLGVTTITLGPKVKKIAKGAFKGTKITTIIVKTKKLKKKSVKGSLKGSKVKTVKVQIGKKKVNKKYVKKYKKIFTKKNAGKKAKVK